MRQMTDMGFKAGLHSARHELFLFQLYSLSQKLHIFCSQTISVLCTSSWQNFSLAGDTHQILCDLSEPHGCVYAEKLVN